MNDYDYIVKMKEEIPQLCHASKIINKQGGKLRENEVQALTAIIAEYAAYLREILQVTDTGKVGVEKKVALVNRYYNFMHYRGYDQIFSSQGKFRPTILEEFLFLLFKNYVNGVKESHDKNNVIGSGAVKAYSNIYFTANTFTDFIDAPKIGVNEKDQDYAIYRTFDIIINDADPMQIRIPALAIEAKTYIDKTMLDSIIATAEKIKSGNPHARFVAVAERYDVSYDVDPAYSRIDQIYVLRRAMRKTDWQEIDSEVVWKLFNDSLEHLNRPWADIQRRIEQEGVVI